MKKIITLLSLFLFAGLSAQTAEQVVDNYLKALGGKEKLASVKSLQKKDTMIANGMSFPMETYQDVNGKIYSTMEMGAQKIVLAAFDGEKGFVFDNATFGYKDVSPEKAKSLKDKAKNLFGYFYDYKKAGHTLKYKGKEIKNGMNAEVVEMHLKEPVEGGVQDLTAYFDAGDHLLKLIEIKNGNNTIVTEIKDYKNFDGILFPVLIETTVNGVPAMTVKTGDVKINVPAPSADKFVKPNQ